MRKRMNTAARVALQKTTTKMMKKTTKMNTYLPCCLQLYGETLPCQLLTLVPMVRIAIPDEIESEQLKKQVRKDKSRLEIEQSKDKKRKQSISRMTKTIWNL